MLQLLQRVNFITPIKYLNIKYTENMLASLKSSSDSDSYLINLPCYLSDDLHHNQTSGVF